ncbi:methionine--tRNA ligase [Thermogladius sp. 4427co]|uniref:methionine--tRNA ligase n=1 Tax=Thermogladius sp. 4427co TaxID=3450718 RepID=UPI003F7954DE
MSKTVEERIYLTTPIYYPNAPPHIGHAYTTVFADVLARYNRLMKKKVFFMTGNDEHGLKIQRAAEKEGVTPKEFVDKMASVYRNYWITLDISFDHFIRTTDNYHERVVSEAFKKLYEKGFIYKAKYSGWYCVDCERYYSPSEYILVEGKPYCPIHNKPLEWLEEETYYFRLSDFKDYIISLLSNTDIVYPASYAREVLNRVLTEGLRDVSVARPRDRVSWGIPVPFDPDYTIYVWFDALLNYVSGVGYMYNEKVFEEFWPVVHHVIGKDILWFHTVVWFSILKALDIPPPKKVIVHSYLVNRGLKIGKSAGNVIPIDYLIDRYHGSDGVRYILMRLFNLDKDVEVSTELMDSIYNSELADTFGNLVRRVGVLAIKKLKGKVYKRDVDDRIENTIHNTISQYIENMEYFDISKALSNVLELGKTLNTYVNDTRPWEKIDPGRELYSLLEGIRALTIMLSPVTPKAASKISESFGFQMVSLKEFKIGQIERYNIRDAPILFKKIQAEKAGEAGSENPPSS